MPFRRVLVLVFLFIFLVAVIRPLNQLVPLQWQKEVNGRRHGLSAYSHRAPHVSLFHRQLLPCLSCGPAAGDVLDGVAGDDDVDDLLGDEELERVFESIGEAEDSGRLESVKRETQGVLQLAAKARRHAGQARL